MRCRHTSLLRCIVFYLLINPVAEAFQGGTFVYVSLDTRQGIAVYKMDPSNGALAFLKTVDVAGQPGSLTVDPTHRYLHAAIRSTNSVASFRIDAASGDLNLLGTVGVGWNPVYLSMDRSGKYLFTAHFYDSKAAVYRVGKNGAVESGALRILTTAANSHSIQTDNSNRFLFIPCRTGEAILEYRFNDTTGIPEANSPDRLTTPDSTGPRHLAFHPFLNTVYAANEFDQSVTAYRIDTVNGTLAPMQTLSMQPGDPRGLAIAANTGGADVHTTPDGRFLYATNRGPDSIAAYAVDSATGLMTSIAHYSTEKMPRSFAIDPSGKFLYAAGQASGTIAAYGIDQADGRLSILNTYYAGSNPVWVLIVQPAAQNTE